MERHLLLIKDHQTFLEELLSSWDNSKKESYIKYQDYQVKINNRTRNIINHDYTCCNCGLKANLISLDIPEDQYQQGSNRCHINIYHYVSESDMLIFHKRKKDFSKSESLDNLYLVCDKCNRTLNRTQSLGLQLEKIENNNIENHLIQLLDSLKKDYEYTKVQYETYSTLYQKYKLTEYKGMRSTWANVKNLLRGKIIRYENKLNTINNIKEKINEETY